MSSKCPRAANPDHPSSPVPANPLQVQGHLRAKFSIQTFPGPPGNPPCAHCPLRTGHLLGRPQGSRASSQYPDSRDSPLPPLACPCGMETSGGVPPCGAPPVRGRQGEGRLISWGEVHSVVDALCGENGSGTALSSPTVSPPAGLGHWVCPAPSAPP